MKIKTIVMTLLTITLRGGGIAVMIMPAFTKTVSPFNFVGLPMTFLSVATESWLHSNV